MGTWGAGILQDDTAADIHAAYMHRFNRGLSPEEVYKAMRKEIWPSLDDEEQPLFYLAVAQAQWECGTLSAPVLKAVERIVATQDDFGPWKEAAPADHRARAKVLDAFVKKIRTPNPKPKKVKKATKRKPLFTPGDCLSFKVGKTYFAGIILNRPVESDDPNQETYGYNLLGMLDYQATAKPPLSLFDPKKKRKWLMVGPTPEQSTPEIYNVYSTGFRAYKDQVEVVGHVELRPDDPSKSSTFAPWPAMFYVFDYLIKSK